MKKRLILLGVGLLLVLLVIPGYLRAFKVMGDSDAPAYAVGGRVFVSYLAYDLVFPIFDAPHCTSVTPIRGMWFSSGR